MTDDRKSGLALLIGSAAAFLRWLFIPSDSAGFQKPDLAILHSYLRSRIRLPSEVFCSFSADVASRTVSEDRIASPSRLVLCLGFLALRPVLPRQSAVLSCPI